MDSTCMVLDRDRWVSVGVLHALVVCVCLCVCVQVCVYMCGGHRKAMLLFFVGVCGCVCPSPFLTSMSSPHPLR